MLSPSHGKGDCLTMIHSREGVSCRAWGLAESELRMSPQWVLGEKQTNRILNHTDKTIASSLKSWGEWLFPSNQHSLQHIWILCPVWAPGIKHWSTGASLEDKVRSWECTMWGEAERDGLVHPGEEMTWGQLTAACQGLWGSYQESWDIFHSGAWWLNEKWE